MRRTVPAIIITVVGLGALASFQSTPGAPTKSAGASVAAPRTTPPATAPPPTDGTTAPTAPAGPVPTTTPARTPRTSPAPVTSPPATSPPTTPPTTAGASRTIDGDPVDMRYGTVQVEVTLQGKTITNVNPLQMPDSHQRSIEISQQAAPLLSQEALQAQSAQIDILSGATFTSEAYAQSLQSALDKARA